MPAPGACHTPRGMKRVLGIVGFSGSGKTTLICGLVRHLPDKRIAVVKRTHHERPGLSGGKDTDRYLEAGAEESILLTPHSVHRFSSGAHNESALQPIEQVATDAALAVDLVIIESAMYDGDWPRLLVHAAGKEIPERLPPRLEAVVTNEQTPVLEGYRHFDRDDLESVARFVIRITS